MIPQQNRPVASAAAGRPTWASPRSSSGREEVRPHRDPHDAVHDRAEDARGDQPDHDHGHSGDLARAVDAEEDASEQADRGPEQDEESGEAPHEQQRLAKDRATPREGSYARVCRGLTQEREVDRDERQDAG